jgi:hypothetical protein
VHVSRFEGGDCIAWEEHPAVTALKTSPPAYLPCGTSRIVVRPCYVKLYDALLLLEKLRDRREPFCDSQDPNNNFRSLKDKGHILCGQPGIGKTLFLSYVLTRRLLSGQRTVMRFPGADEDIIFEEGGPRTLVMNETLLSDSSIWALCDYNLTGIPAQTQWHNWLMLLSSSPRKTNFERFNKDFLPNISYFLCWEWPEMVTAL